MTEGTRGKVPVLLLKTKSAPADAYEEYFSDLDNLQYHPDFVPVLEHQFKLDALERVRNAIVSGNFVRDQTSGLPKYGAMIFTSQRAVEAFTSVVEWIRGFQGRPGLDDLLTKDTPLYVVGPATARGLKALGLQCPILGEETGTGEILSDVILEHYNGLYQGPENPPILFLVGDKRRDIIPKKLQSLELPSEKRSRIDELVVYETGEMQSFKKEFSLKWRENGPGRQWVVVFSPTGCKAMLESLGLLDEDTGKAKPDASQRDILVATIGPTTRDYMISEFNFTADVCAEKPTPEGVGSCILSFTQTLD